MVVLERNNLQDPHRRLATSLSASGESSLLSSEFAAYLDRNDFVTRSDNFHFPTNATVWPEDYQNQRQQEAPAAKTGDHHDDDDEIDPSAPSVYLAGNSLGLMPIQTPILVQEELSAWQTRGVLGHTEHPFGRPWVQIDEIVTATLAEVVGAKTSEVACMGSLTSNIHTLFTSFYRPTEQRHKIMYEGKAFPSDQYAFASQVEMRGYSPSSLLPIDPRPGEYTIRTEDILQVIEEQGDSIAIICFGAVQFYSGQWFDMEAITKAGHAKGCLVAFDCAHSVGNVPMKLHHWGVDFAAWCSYKYLNAGPGGIAGLFVHERWAEKKRLAGWWGHDSASRFAMPNTFLPNPGTAGWQLSNPSVLDVISLYSSLEIFRSAGTELPSRLAGGQSTSKAPILAALREKSVLLTAYLETVLKHSPYYVSVDRLAHGSKDVAFSIITPSDPAQRGAQLSLLFEPVEAMDPIFERLRELGVLGDERRPGVIRLAPTPLYNSFEDARKAASRLDRAIKGYIAGVKV